jgi:hypothetical protein
MSSQGFGNSKRGSRTADASEVIRNMRLMAQNAADRTYQSDPKRMMNRSSDAVLATYAAQSAAQAQNYVAGNTSGNFVSLDPSGNVVGRSSGVGTGGR